MTIETAVVNVARLVRGLEDMKGSPDLPPEKMSDFPFAVTILESGQSVEGTGIGSILTYEEHVIRVEIHAARKNLPTDIQKILPYWSRLVTALKADPDLGGSVDFVKDLSHNGVQGLSWGSEQNNHIGIAFLITVAIDNC